MAVRYGKELPETGRYDLLVCGGGPAGFSAALTAARRGLRVLLIEAKHQLGGMGTCGLVSHWLGGRSNEGAWVVGGIFREIAEEATALGIAVLPNPADYAGLPVSPYGLLKGQLLAGVPFDPFSMAPFLERKLVESGVEIRYETSAVDALVRDGEITHVIACGKDGLSALGARLYVDATGDADVATRAGCRFDMGHPQEGLSPVSLIFHVENVEEERLLAYVVENDDRRYRKLLAALRAQGVDCFNYGWMIFVKMNREGAFMINGRILEDVDGTDPRDRTRAYLVERAKVDGTITLFRDHFPGCRRVTLRAVASSLGVRETRRIQAESSITVKDVIEGAPAADTVGYSAYGWDLLNRDGTQGMHGIEKPPFVGLRFLPMVPRAVTNLVCPGRAIGAERHVLGPVRVQAPVMAMGQAAATACALALRSRTRLRDLDPLRLAAELAADRAILTPGGQP